jgi:hypothetical protein
MSTDTEVAMRKLAVTERGRAKASITRLKNTFDKNALLNSPMELSIVKRQRLVDAFTDYERLSVQIVSMFDSPPASLANDDDEVEENYICLLAQLDGVINILRQSVKRTLTSEGNNNIGNGHIHLPTIQIRTFSGKYTEYYDFISMFTAMIHSSTSFTSVQKLYYLKGYLSGEPLALVNNLPLQDESYPEALKLLKERYENKVRIIHEHINSLLDMPSVARTNVGNLREFLSEVKQKLAALKNLGEPVDSWNSVVVCILSRKLDHATYRAFQLERDNTILPTASEFLGYIEKRALAIENSDVNIQKVPLQRFASHPVTAVQGSPPAECLYCKSTQHKLFKCPTFAMAAAHKRMEFALANKLCNICLSNHQRKCKYFFRCSVCKLKHNTLLHQDANNKQYSAPTPSVTLTATARQGHVLLPTARVKLIASSGLIIYARALLDSASQASFVTQKVVDLLGKPSNKANTTIIGITNAVQTVDKCINLDVHSAVYPFKINVNCHIVNTITSKLPQTQINLSQIALPPNCKLADESFDKPGDVHLLLGADIFFQVLLPQPQQTKGEPVSDVLQPLISAGSEQTATSCSTSPGSPSLVYTSFGLVIAGRTQLPANSNQVVSLFCRECDSTISEQLSAFWDTEKVPEIFPEKLPEHEYCEKFFRDTTKLEDNKYEVSMPIKVPLEQMNSELGDSFHLALNRFLNLEKRLHMPKNVTLFNEYKKFIDQYVDMKHGDYHDMDKYDLAKDAVFFLPHHPVIRQDARTTKLRCVFDGSALTKKKVSLNDLLFNGAVAQRELFDILTLFRTDKFFLICDIKAMFRCINLNPAQRSLQNILWRESPEQDIKCIQLNTVSYGLRSSSFLATRCLSDLVERNEHSMPLAASAIRNSTYVDDILVSCGSEQKLVETQSQLVQMLSMGSFQLHKWASNCKQVLENVPKDSHYLGEVDLQKDHAFVKTLGIRLDVKSDAFKSTCPEPYSSPNDSKRDILSYISKFYDPLGLIGPVFVRAKVIMQMLWEADSNWDSTPPDNIRKVWTDFINDLSQMQPVVIARCVKTQQTVVNQLIGFADASSVAYGCCLYLRTIDKHGNVRTELLCSKSRINPSKKKLTIPKAELNAVLLLSELVKRVHNTVTIKLEIHDVHVYSDSQIVLAWLKTDAAKLLAYVANRVRAVGKLTHGYHWHYVHTSDNPADCLSRGLQPQEIADHNLWWHGPTFLLDKECNFSEVSPVPTELPELKPVQTSALCLTTTMHPDVFDIINRFSTIGKMTRVLAYILRFCNNVKPTSQNRHGFLTAVELDKVLMLLVKHEQGKFYSDDIKLLQSLKQVKGNLKPLTPFLDSEGIIRVGGRLQNASLPFAAQHPAILPQQSVVTALIVRNEHLCLLHAGQKLVLCSLRQRFWIIDGLRTVKKVIHKCVICFRLKATANTQLMGSLPTARVTACRVFGRVGVDFAGPVSVKNSRIRKPVIGKGYIALFVCFVTKAIHLELCSDLTTECFLACFKRFIARRNLPSDVYCDNASTFKGTRNQLDEFYRLHASQAHQQAVNSFATQKGINFHFIPSYSPIFGGLWESGVKSTKHHLKRVVGKALLTYEQLNSVLIEIEGVLNSRPLTAITNDPNDFSYLSAGHFLTGAALNTYPEQDLSNKSTNLLKFWSIITNMKQTFWKYWSKHYLNQLQNRPKWQSVTPNVAIGSLVILRSDNSPPLEWPMARVTNLFPGKDGIVRAVEVRTANGHSHNRSIIKICVLPVEV